MSALLHDSLLHDSPTLLRTLTSSARTNMFTIFHATLLHPQTKKEIGTSPPKQRARKSASQRTYIAVKKLVVLRQMTL